MPLRKASLEALEQVFTIVSLAEAVYTWKTQPSSQPIGTHVRHIIDHYWAMQDGLTTGNIDYNQRNRNTLLETEPETAIKALEAIKTWLQTAPLSNTQVNVTSEISIDQTESIQTQSCVDRELMYLINHTLHHVAYASLTATSLGIKTSALLGVAPATASYLRKLGQDDNT